MKPIDFILGPVKGDDPVEINESGGSWKIDYIRVESEESTPAAKKKPGKKKSRAKRTKDVRLPDKAVKKDAEENIPVRTELKPIVPGFFPKKLKIAYKIKSANETIIEKSNSTTTTNAVPDWSNIFTSNVNSQHCQHIESLLQFSQSPRVPKLTKHASPALLDLLTDEDLETNACPGCGDTFLLPATFFQHIYRKSVMISLNCRPCSKRLTFSNKCLLRIHSLSHFEEDAALSVQLEDIDILSLNMSELTSKDESFSKQHRRMIKEMKRKGEAICLECMASFPLPAALISHLTRPQGVLDSSLLCDICNKYFPSACSLVSHRRIHKRVPPYICPECSEEFCTWSIFKVICLTCPKCGLMQQDYAVGGGRCDGTSLSCNMFRDASTS